MFVLELVEINLLLQVGIFLKKKMELRLSLKMVKRFIMENVKVNPGTLYGVKMENPYLRIHRQEA